MTEIIPGLVGLMDAVVFLAAGISPRLFQQTETLDRFGSSNVEQVRSYLKILGQLKFDGYHDWPIQL